MAVLSKVTPVTGTFTVTVQLAVLLPSTVVTVILADPAPIAVTTPSASTVATEVFELLQVTSLLVAVVGLIVAVRVPVEPLDRDSVVLLRETPVTGTVTVTVQVAVLEPSAVVTVIVAVPAVTAVTLPSESTVATEVLELFHVTAVLVALVGAMVAVRVSVEPLESDRVVLLRETPVTGTPTVTVHLAV